MGAHKETRAIQLAFLQFNERAWRGHFGARIAAITVSTLAVFALVGPEWGAFTLSCAVTGFCWDFYTTRALHKKLIVLSDADAQRARAERADLIRIVAIGSALYCVPFAMLAFAPQPGPVLGIIFASGAVALIIAHHILTPTMSLWTLPTPTLAIALGSITLAPGWLGIGCAALALMGGANAFILTIASWRSSQALISAQLDAECTAETLEERVSARTAELEVATSQAEAASKLTIQLTGGVAHDFNNALAAITSSTEILRTLSAEDARRPRLIETISLASARASDLTRKLLAYSRKQVLEPKFMSLNAAVDEVVQLMRPLIGSEITIETHFDPRDPVALLDPAQFSSAMLNLALNARDAMPKGGRISLTTLQLDDFEGMGPCGAVDVNDDGAGIAPDIQERIFDPYFTTKETGRGSGLGLSMVQGFVLQSQGRIGVTSAPGAGACFRMAFPLQAAPAENLNGTAPAPALQLSSGGLTTVLLVEDDSLVREALVLWLEDNGHSVLAAADGAEAITLLSAAPALDVLITDVVMPGGWSGVQLAAEARRRFPGVGVLVISGHTQDKLEESGKHIEGMTFLQKPFPMAALSRKIAAFAETRTQLAS